jgi:predicted NBD/HSP70 family sugar kinase
VPEQAAGRDGVTPILRPRRLAEKSLPGHNRRHNRSLVLQHLFHRGAMSRADLARESGLTRVTIGELVAELQSDGLVRELGPRPGARPGKPATLIAVDVDATGIVAIDLSPDDRVVGAVLNLRGEVLHRAAQPLAGAGGEAAVEAVLALAAELVRACPSRLLGIGVGTPGIVDDGGVVRQAPNLGWYELDLGARIRRAFGCPVQLANDANAAALGVHSFALPGEGREGDEGSRPGPAGGGEPGAGGESLLVVRIEHGVGAGLIVGGALVRGEQFAAGEIGHVVIDEDGEPCACGRRGCLEAVIAAPRLRSRLAAAGTEGRARVLTDAGRALGVALAPIVSILNLNLVVLSGPPELIGGTLAESARRTLRARTMSAVSNGLELRTAPDGEDLVLRGAAVLVLSSELGVA